MNRIVVSDSACLIGLERVQRLDLLAAVFGEVIVPPAEAARLQVPVRGLLGVLVLAKRSGKLAAVAPVIADLKRQNFFISEALVAEVLKHCGETLS